MSGGGGDWRADNRANWDERVAVRLGPGSVYDLGPLRAGQARLDAIAPRPAGAMPSWFVPYFERAALVLEDSRDYANPAARLRNARTHAWMHPLSSVLGALTPAGLALDRLHEHPRVPWRMFECLVRDADGPGPGPTVPGCRSPTRCRRRGGERSGSGR